MRPIPTNKHPFPGGPWLTAPAAAAHLGVTDQTVRNMVDRGELTAYVKFRGKNVVHLQDVDALKQRRENPPPHRDQQAWTRGSSAEIARWSAKALAAGQTLAEWLRQAANERAC